MTVSSDSSRREIVARRGLGVVVVLMLIVHVVPPWGDPEWILLGIVPWDLAYPLLWILVASVVVVYMTGAPWPDEPPPSLQPPLEPEPPPRSEEPDP